jgi:small subunit ribosomal protein S6
MDPDLDEEAVGSLRDRFVALAKANGAELGQVTLWRKRRLAYDIKGKREGTYAIMQMRAEPAAVAEVERQLKLTESVLRYLIVRADEIEPPRAEEAQPVQPQAEPAEAEAEASGEEAAGEAEALEQAAASEPAAEGAVEPRESEGPDNEPRDLGGPDSE